MNGIHRSLILGLAAAAIAAPIVGVQSQASATPNIPGAVMFAQKPGERSGAFSARCNKASGIVQKRKAKLVCVVPPRSAMGSMSGMVGRGHPTPQP